MKENAAKVRTEGERIGKRVFLVESKKVNGSRFHAVLFKQFKLNTTHMIYINLKTRGFLLLLFSCLASCSKDNNNESRTSSETTTNNLKNQIPAVNVQSSIDLKLVDEVMLFLNGQNKFRFAAKQNKEEGDKYGSFKAESEEYIYFDFKYDKTSKALSWKAINNSTHEVGSKYTSSCLGNGSSYQSNYKMNLENFSGIIVSAEKSVCGKPTVELKIKHPAKYVWFDKQKDISNRQIPVCEPYFGFFGDQNLESKNLEEKEQNEVSFNLEPSLANRLKPALEDLFKAHGAKVSKY